MNTRTAIAAALEAADGWVSGQGLARLLGISRAAVGKQVKALLAAGYAIEAVPHRGYRWVSAPDTLLPERLVPLLHTATLGRDRIVHAASMPSTNLEASRLAAEGCAEGVLAIAETQTAGKGRRGRHWESPPGQGIYVSLVLRPRLPLDRVPLLTLMTAVAVAEAIHAVTGAAPRIKWPNDILLNGRKIAGVLSEVASEIDAVGYAIVGLGINVNTPLDALPDRPLYPASSLAVELGAPVDRARLLAAWLDRMEVWRDRLAAEGGIPRVLARWRALAGTLGQTFVVRTGHGNGEFRARAVDVDDDGALIVETSDGARHRILSGDLAPA